MFTQKGHYETHLNRKRPCKPDPNIEQSVNIAIRRLEVGLFHTRSYSDVKIHYDNILNKDKTTFTSSNDEPTPIGCIEEMMTSVPDEFWGTPGLRILDPCCGNGNFHFVIAEKLRNAGQNPIELLHFNDLNTTRLQNVTEIFGRDVQQTSYDFLEHSFGTYDMVVMNPPYAKLMQDGQRASKNHGLSIPFLEKGLACLKDGGYLVAIIPDNWMSLADRNTLCKTLTGYQFLHLDIHTAKRWFPKVGSSFTWFVLQKTPGRQSFPVSYLYKTTLYKSIVEPQVCEFIPLWYSADIQSIFQKTIEGDRPRYKIETSSDLHKYTKRDLIADAESADFPYRLIHTPKQTVWSSRAHKFQKGWKVFLSTTDKYGVFVDKDCGMTQSIAFIRTDTEEQANTICAMLQHPLYRFLNNACRYGNFNNIRVMQKFPISTINPYDAFDITPEEILCIEGHL
jgi:adenine-specific DNA-methyltransferase